MTLNEIVTLSKHSYEGLLRETLKHIIWSKSIIFTFCVCTGTRKQYVYSAPAHDISISPLQTVYVVDDVINCSAKGWPEPSVQWYPVSSSSLSQLEPQSGSSLTIGVDMVGENVWKCVAANQLNGVNGSEAVVAFHTFNVTTGDYAVHVCHVCGFIEQSI